MINHPETLLKRANGIELLIESAQTITVIVGSKQRVLPNDALHILNVFSHPISLKEALQKIPTAGKADWIGLTSSIQSLREIGALVNHSQDEAILNNTQSGFGSAPIHIMMLNDRLRTDSFIKGIKNAVKQGDVVIDIGTGTGVLAIAAARAGAKRVYAIEASAIADIALATIQSTEVADKITLIRGWSTQINLPEKADVLVSEIIGNDPFNENIVHIFQDAKDRLLKPDARIVPSGIKVYAHPVKLPQSILLNNVLRKKDLENWHSWYQVNFSALKNAFSKYHKPVKFLTAKEAKKLTGRGKAISLIEADFLSQKDFQPEQRIHVIKQDAFDGLIIYFELNLGNEILTNHPFKSVRTSHWDYPVFYLPQMHKIKQGEEFVINYNLIRGESKIKIELP